MNPCFILEINAVDIIQEEKHQNYIGGIPHLPEEEPIPACQLCKEQLTFFFQVSYPEEHSWHGFSMGVFQCTSCVHEDYLVPEMLEGTLTNIHIPERFLEDYQKNFRVIVFETSKGILKSDYKPKIKFKKIELTKTIQDDINANKIGGKVNWILEDEAPASYNAKIRMIFLLQILEGATFDLLPDAPPQMELSLTGKPVPSDHSYYELFLGNQLYFFGTIDSCKQVYIITQV